jgi:hypothetical protein
MLIAAHRIQYDLRKAPARPGSFRMYAPAFAPTIVMNGLFRLIADNRKSEYD